MEQKLTRLIYQEDCQKASMYCQDALNFLKAVDIEENQEGLEWWLVEYDDLYRLLTNQPRGLPGIQRTTCDGVRYPVLREFWRKYNQLRFPIKYDDEDELKESDGEDDNEDPK
jgi:hypothetical protein